MMKKVRCPQCGGESIYAVSNPWRPFCGERCKMIDLGAWASDQYAIPGPATSADENGADDVAFPVSPTRQ